MTRSVSTRSFLMMAFATACLPCTMASQVIKRIQTRSLIPIVAPVTAPPPSPGGLKPPPSLTPTWPDYPCVVVQSAPWMNHTSKPVTGLGPSQCWIPVTDFSVQKDLNNPAKETHFLVRFSIKSGPWMNEMQGSVGAWFYNVEFQAKAPGSLRRAIVSASGQIKDIHWHWVEGAAPGFVGDVVQDTTKYFIQAP